MGNALPGARPERASRSFRRVRGALVTDADHLARRLAEAVLGRAGPHLDDVALARPQLAPQLGRLDLEPHLGAALDLLEGREQRLARGPEDPEAGDAGAGRSGE